MVQKLTPMMQQYVTLQEEARRRHPMCVLLFRLGDFYEIFNDDAPKVAAALNIQLTCRNKKDDAEDIPMCGIPWHQLDSYLPQLIKAGYAVAIAEQTETPEAARQRVKNAGGSVSKVLVTREIVRIVTAGTLTEENLLQPASSNYLAAVAVVKGQYGVAWLDVSTGLFYTEGLQESDLAARLSAINPSELLIADTLRDTPELYELWRRWQSALTIQPATVFNKDAAARRLQDHYEVTTLESFGDFSVGEVAASGALLAYVHLTQQATSPTLAPPRQLQPDAHLQLDAATRRSLELTETQRGERKGSLLYTIDRTITAAGARLLAQHLAWPLTNVDQLNHRYDLVAFWQANSQACGQLRDTLKTTPDLERAIGRLGMNRGGPRDLAMVRDALVSAENIAAIINKLGDLPPVFNRLQLPTFLEITQKLSRALVEQPPALAREGNFIQEGYNHRLDTLKNATKDRKIQLANLQSRYRQETGVATLKIKHNNIIGYHVEVSSRFADQLKEPFIHRQTLATCARFTTSELNKLQASLLRSEEEALALENTIYSELAAAVVADVTRLRRTAKQLARLDVAASWATLAEQYSYTRPELVPETVFKVHQGRHVVVEQHVANSNSAAQFMANNCRLNVADRLWLLTGPNMAGKSTFLRQNALMVIMAQMGGFVPAEHLQLGIVDRLFSRVGAADDLAQGRSTFMVEMVETAAILNQATERSFVILDEIGRGTATYDGLSIAWAVLEYLHHSNQCRGLFATHYHELTLLADDLPSLTCHTMQVEEADEDVVFLHQVIPGVAERSYGIFVAKLAGMPGPVVERAGSVMEDLEGKPLFNGGRPEVIQEEHKILPLFDQAAPSLIDGLQLPTAKIVRTEPHPVTKLLANINPDELSPKEALEELYALKEELALRDAS